MEAQTRLFASLAPRPAPPALENAVALELQEPSEERLVRALRRLPEVPAPPTLDALVQEALVRSAAAVGGDSQGPMLEPPVLEPDALERAVLHEADHDDPTSGVPRERQVRNAQLLRMLAIQAAPAVLDRLVEEELVAPESHRIRRFSDLERKTAPVDLARRLDRGFRRRALLKALWGPMATLAAAGVLVWVALQGEGLEQVNANERGSLPRERSFEVIRVTHADQLGPVARGFVGSLAPASLFRRAPEGAMKAEGELPR